MEPAGMKYPSYISPFVTRCGMPDAQASISSVKDLGYQHPPSGATGCQRKTSFSTAPMYGSLSWSQKSGSRESPRTVSISACAARCTSGYSAIARKNVCKAETVLRTVQSVNRETLDSQTHGICTAQIHVSRKDLGQSNVFCCGFVAQLHCHTRSDRILGCSVRLDQRQCVCRDSGNG
jgi:hypothetical protein